MRIAVSGTHCSGKTTLVEDFLERHPEYVHEPEPYEWLDEASAEPTADEILHQLRISVERLSAYRPGSNVIAERSPIDFLAYLEALPTLGRESTSRMFDAVRELVNRGMEHVDLLVILPLNDDIETPEDEDPELREAMNACLLEIVDDVLGQIAGAVRLVEIGGTPQQRLVALEAEIEPTRRERR